MRVRFLEDRGHYKAGEIYVLEFWEAVKWTWSGAAEFVGEEEVATLDPRPETAVKKRGRPRGRPRKTVAK